MKIQSNRNSYSLLLGMKNGITTLQENLAVFSKAKYGLTVKSSNYSHYLLNWFENCLCAHKDLYMNVYSNFTHNCQKWKQLRYPWIDEWINKWWNNHAIEYYSSIKRNKYLIHATTWMNLKTYVEWKCQSPKGYILYNSICVTFLR